MKNLIFYFQNYILKDAFNHRNAVLEFGSLKILGGKLKYKIDSLRLLRHSSTPQANNGFSHSTLANKKVLG
jgi:hypothetical protein